MTVGADARDDRPLSSLGPFIVAANVRGPVTAEEWRVGAGRGLPGDLVLGDLVATPGRKLTIADSSRDLHTIESNRRVLAVLGPRDSSTHVCATIPEAGLEVYDGAEAFWVAGESGIVGQLERDAIEGSVLSPEAAAGFRCVGLVVDRSGRAVNVRRFTVRPETPALSTPVVLVAATSSEAGKTVLIGELIRLLVARGVRVGAIKASGTGGVMDSVQHAAAGAAVTLDHVDAGLITTHDDAREFHERIPLVFRATQDHRVDVILAELGGDLVSANNPEIFTIGEIVNNARLMLVVCNDALAAAGVQHLNRTRLRFPDARIRYLTSPFRNHPGMARRMQEVGVSQSFDPRSRTDLEALAGAISDAIGGSRSS